MGETPVLRRVAFQLPRHPASIATARHRIREQLVAWSREAWLVEDAVLVVSELTTNTVRHGHVLEREFEVAVTMMADGSCVVEVADGGSRYDPVPPSAQPPPEAESGRGLRLVDSLAESWGVWNRGRFGKTVWALLRPAGDAGG
ncbi:ATP-binding protein [Streptomyces sp. SAJ15]|uniref:ATP-binding protein n=1 Tax=Streptomyces sp. SAJ15 TaxID=2011095 RepID=UPI0011853635|nr:ATP-binding protein [Streptomyces sp. SAJ15]TVL90224.1 ATP-binding protein [Streptomyces sp. SAJ15]